MSGVWKILIAAVALTGTVAMQERLPQPRISDGIVFEFNEGFATYSPETLRLMTFGYAKAASDLLWLRFLYHTPPKKIGRNQVSWLYLDLDAISELDPDFTPVYDFGGMFISVITEDKRGAELILRKGVKRFPNLWRLSAYLAYHYQFELGEPEKAYPYYLAAAKIPESPPLFKVIASSLLAKHNGKGSAVAFLNRMIKDATDPRVKEKLTAKLNRITKGGK